uniref:Uncharacterized protein n=1 Tax=Helicotheca tamesis TaxID=374047 RepID=A0A7S2H1K8_9STRA|mmetsp:Transcript_14369/g.19668  ORF Transcript_14369/g.19668 Transcript_14369/m.19668 type:complete len:268 (+) Transcript_14369:76-879(+)|eukprot:CAMPEP_0185729108 /NCGR_PEP_ID=MMETSP1171-20130828/4472_1 /TAXON_ID=374046 /ORGANISM="Helicotheca tamensis, Strain CCMP826" /LENGTH=267 /DNA_ID=CAMNT_0028397885 /DNA_START=76 /DNA_END=879 /DNA_ORIENTATION=+
MKFSKIFATTAFFLLAEHITADEKSFSLRTDPLCVQFDKFDMEGRSQFVDTDNNGIPEYFGDPMITAGDMSVAAHRGKFSLVGSYTGSKFDLRKFDMQAICMTLEDQAFVPFSAPECRIEIDLEFCRKLTVIGFVGDIKDDRRRGLDHDEFYTIGRRKDLIDLINENDPQIDVDTYRKIDPELLATNLCFGNREGKLTAIGTGPGHYAITGGTRDFFGAFGQINMEFQPYGVEYDPETGDVNLEMHDTKLQFCYERACESGKFDCHH